MGAPGYYTGYSGAPRAPLDLLFACLSDAHSVWVKPSAGGYIFMARVTHTTEDFTVGPWQRLEGGWHHMNTFWYYQNVTIAHMGEIRVCAIDEERFFLAFGMYGSTNYAMVVRSNGDGTFTSGTPIEFQAGIGTFIDNALDANGVRYYFYNWGSMGVDTYVKTTAPDRVLLIGTNPTGNAYAVNNQITSDMVSAVQSRAFSANGLTLIDNGVSNLPAGLSMRFGYSDDQYEDGWWGWGKTQTLVSGSFYRFDTYLAWFREVNGAVVRGPDHLFYSFIDNPSVSHYRPPELFVASAGQGRFVVAWYQIYYRSSGSSPTYMRYTRIHLQGDAVVVDDDAYSQFYRSDIAYGASERVYVAAPSFRSVVDMYQTYNYPNNTYLRQTRHVTLPTTVYQFLPSATSTNTHPPDQNVLGEPLVYYYKLSTTRVLAVFAVSGFSTLLDFNHKAALRLVLMDVPPVCPTIGPGGDVGPPTIRVAQTTAVVRMTTTATAAPAAPRDPCGYPEGALSDRGPVRVHPLARR